MSLGELEAHNEKALKASEQNKKDPRMITTGGSVESHLPAVLDVEVNGGNHSNSDSTSLPLPQSASDTPPFVSQTSSKSSVLYVFTSAERMWYAATGHGPDFEKVPSKEFVCLSIIASHGARGILQPDLVRLSGQDKRSVPVRTQNLHEKGYIVKTPVIKGGSRTSLCTLTRFALQHKTGPANTDEAPDVRTISSGEEVSTNLMRQSIYGHVEQELRHTLEVLKELKLITWTDLKKKVVRTPVRSIFDFTKPTLMINFTGCI